MKQQQERRIQGLAVAATLVVAALTMSACASDGGSGNDAPVIADNLADRIEAAKEEGVVTLYTTYDLDLSEPLAEAFEAEYPEIDVQVTWLRTDELTGRIEAEFKTRDTIDVELGNFDSFVEDFAKDEIFAEYRPDGLPADLEQWMGTNDRYMTIGVNPNVLMYNTDLVSESDIPQSWEGMADPDVLGDRWGIVNPATRGGGYWWFYNTYNAFGEEYFEALAANKPLIYDGPSAVAAAIASGEIAWGVTNDHGAWGAVADGAPVGVLYPEEGVWQIERTASVAERAPHPNAARLFLDWLVTENGQNAVASALGLYSVNPTIEGPAPHDPGHPATLGDMNTSFTVDRVEFVAMADTIVAAAMEAFGVE